MCKRAGVEIMASTDRLEEVIDKAAAAAAKLKLWFSANEGADGERLSVENIAADERKILPKLIRAGIDLYEKNLKVILSTVRFVYDRILTNLKDSLPAWDKVDPTKD